MIQHCLYKQYIEGNIDSLSVRTSEVSHNATVLWF